MSGSWLAAGVGGCGVLSAAIAAAARLATGAQLVLILVAGILVASVVGVIAKVILGPDEQPTNRLVRLITAWRGRRRRS